MIEHELPEGWQNINFGNKYYFSIESGGTPKTNEPTFWNGNIDWATLVDLPQECAINFIKNTNRKISTIGLQKSSARLLPKHSVILSSRATIGRVALAEVELSTNQGFKNIIIHLPNLIDNKFVAYNLLSRKNELTNMSKGTTFKELSKANLEMLNMPLPPIKQQKQIVNKVEQLFGELDDGVNVLQTLKQQVKVFRQSILKAAFSGKLTGSYVSDDELPTGWDTDKIANIFEVYIGSTPSRRCPEFWNGDINWVSSGEVAFNKITYTKEKITSIALEESSCKLHPKGTVLMGMIGEGKTRGQVAILEVEASHNQNSAAIRIDDSVYLSETLFYYLVLKYEENRGIGSGNNQKALNKSRVGDILVPVIPIEEQKQIVAKIKTLFAICDELDTVLDATISQSTLLRQSILKQAFSGKLI